MAKILIVDDERDYCDELEDGLSRLGHHVFTADNAYDAVEIGVLKRPELLITDWMLRDHYNGLVVAEALRAVLSELSVILITGYASNDLRAHAKLYNYFDFLEKPFGLKKIKNLVDEMQSSTTLFQANDSEDQLGTLVGAVQFQHRGVIDYINADMAQMLDEFDLPSTPVSISSILGPSSEEIILTASAKWIEVSPVFAPSQTWKISVKNWPQQQTRIMLVLGDKKDPFQESLVAQLILGRPSLEKETIPTLPTVLVADRHTFARKLSMESLSAAGCSVHGATAIDEALSLLRKDRDLGVCIIDHDMVSADLPGFLTDLQIARPGITLVGTGESSCREDFRCLGISKFLPKPWQASDLSNLLHRG